MLTVAVTGAIGITGPKTTNLNLPAQCGAQDCNPLDEVRIRTVLNDQTWLATSNQSEDNREYGKDLDPSPNRLVASMPAQPAEELRGGTLTSAMCVSYDPESKRPLTLDMISEEGNLEKHVRWQGDQIVSSYDRRVLADGRVETLDLHYNPSTGALTCVENLAEARPDAG